MNLRNVFTGNQTVMLVDPKLSDGNECHFTDGLILILTDIDTGKQVEFTVTPDVVSSRYGPEAQLAFDITPVINDDLPTYLITPSGQEFIPSSRLE